MATRKELGAVMAVLTAAYPMMNITKPTMDVYAQELSDVPVKFLLDAAHQHVKRCRFFPAIAELREAYDAQRHEHARLEKERQWKANLEEWKQDAIGPGEAKRLLTDVIDAASKKKDAALIPFRGRGLKRALSEKPREYQLGADAPRIPHPSRRHRAGSPSAFRRALALNHDRKTG